MRRRNEAETDLDFLVNAVTRCATAVPIAHWRALAARHPALWPALAAGLSIVGYVSFGLAMWTAIAANGGIAYDASSYWAAAQNAAVGETLYWPVGIGDPEAYRYLPTFAHVLAPLSAVPALVLTWLFRFAAFLCLRYLVGSWTVVGWALILPPVSIELEVLNLTFPIAAATRLALRGGTSGAVATPVAAVLKYGSILLIPYLWIRRPGLRQPLLLGSVGVAAALLIHALIDPQAWADFVRSLAQQSQSANIGSDVNEQLLALAPNTLLDFAIRFTIGAGLVAIAARKGWDWLAFVAVVIAVPTLWVARLAPLVAVPRLWLEDRDALSSGETTGDRGKRG